VTRGPGLEPALWTGITFAQELAKEWQKPLFGANHMEGHLFSSLAQPQHSNILQNVGMLFVIENVSFPVLALLISGGHTEFIHMQDWLSFERIGETLDDAVGECFDKVARMLDLPYPGGPRISKLADEARTNNFPASKIKLPRPMLHSGNCDVSFSGLKTAALYALRDIGGADQLNAEEKAAFAREFEETVGDVFVAKMRKALEQTGANTFVIGGGVSANAYLRERLSNTIKEEFPEVEVRLPDLSITGDNGIMIAEAALVHFLLGDWTLENPPRELRATGNLSIA
jgi:N6-L-threonylcarbamoyladenine synthase